MMKKIEELEEESKISKDELRRLKEKLEDLALITQRASQDSQPVSWWASAWLLWAWMW
jgi:transcription initiation factor IIE alpha subunit